MATNPTNINPLDINPNKAVGINLPLNAPSVFQPNFTTKDAVKADLINFLLTDPGERPLNPSFGGGLRAFIFQQLTDGSLDLLREDLQVKIQQNFPNVIIKELDINETSSNSIRINFTYNIKFF